MYLEKSSLKISLYASLALVISFTLFFLIMYNLPDTVYQNYENFFSQNLGNNKKIFIIGSSHVMALDPIIMKNLLAEQNLNYEVYNLGIPSDDFEERQRSINMMLEHEPDVVVIGIEPRYFESHGRTQPIFEEGLPRIPSINQFLDMIDFGNKKGILTNPKFAMIKTLANPFETVSPSFLNKHSPFFILKPENEIILEDAVLRNLDSGFVPNINSLEKNSNLFALNNILEQLSQNNIKIVIFVTPHSKYFIEKYPESQKIQFEKIIDEISKNYVVYSLYDKYIEKNFWSDNTHLAINENTKIYSNDVSQFIIEVLRK